VAQKIEVSLPDGSRKYVKNSVAFKMVADSEAYFTDSSKTRLIALRGRNPRFDEFWSIKPSGGIPTWQYQP
jgi:hypothetical protein